MIYDLYIKYLYIFVYAIRLYNMYIYIALDKANYKYLLHMRPERQTSHKEKLLPIKFTKLLRLHVIPGFKRRDRVG